MTWHFTPHSHKPAGPVDNDDEPLLVVPNTERGGFSLRFENSKTLIGHFPTPEAAEKYANTQCQHVRIVLPQRASSADVTPMAPVTQKAHHLIHST